LGKFFEAIGLELGKNFFGENFVRKTNLANKSTLVEISGKILGEIL
jgi:Leu/Phe-tRNA-protein transferase